MLTKEQKLAILSKAIEEGANIWIDIHDLQPAQAETKIKEYAQHMGTKVIAGGKGESKWFTTGTEYPEMSLMKVTAFVKGQEESEYMVEDVKFEEEVEA